jgi:putative ABC transport system permease protein
MLNDLRYGLRMLVKSPAFTAVAVLSLALGIGANTIIFSLVDAVLLRPLPFHDSARLVQIFENNFVRKNDHNVASPRNFLRWREQNHAFDQMSALATWPANLNDNAGLPERATVGVVSPNLFSMLGVQPLRGRLFANDEERPEKGQVVLLTQGYWQRRYSGDPALVGRTIQLSERPFTIIGIVPDRIMTVDMYVPFVVNAERLNSEGRYLSVIARLRPGMSLPQARADMDVVAAHNRAEMPDFDAGWGVNVRPLRDEVVSRVSTGLLVLQGAVLFVLLIACANIANMLLARGSARMREMAVRISLGATRARIVRQVLTESVMLGLMGGLAGLLLAFYALTPLVGVLPAEIPAYREIGINLRVLGFSVAISLLTGIVFGVATALRASTITPHVAMKGEGRGTTGGRERNRVRNTLVIAEFATALVLLAGAGLLIHSFVNLMNVDPGFDPSHVLTMQANLPGRDYFGKPELQTAYFQQALERVRALPGVEAASAISYLPLEAGAGNDFTVDDRPKPPAGEEPVGEIRIATEDYFRAMHIPLVRGRWFDPAQDHAGDAIKKIVISRRAAENLWPGQDPLGKRITMEWYSVMHAEVIGVVGDVKLSALNLPVNRSTLYWYMPQFPSLFMAFVIRTNGDAMSMAEPVRKQVASVKPDLPIAKIRSMEDILSGSVRQPRFTTELLAAFSALALLLAGIGIYGVISYFVAQRTQELGVRMALGAQPRDILRLVVGQGLRLALAGLVIGIVAALLVTRLMNTMLFNVQPADPLALVGGAILLISVAVLANLLPARRALRVDPIAALRYE